MDMVKISVTGIMCLILAVTLKNHSPVFSLAVTLMGGVIILLYILPQLASALDIIKNISGYMKSQDKYLKLLFKIIGISYIGSFSSQLCADSGQKALGDKIDLAAKILIGIYTLPVIQNMMDIINRLMP